jgi:hypothetical protein
MDLSETGVCEKSAAFVRSPGRRHIATLRIGRKVKHVTVTAGGKNHRVGCVGADLACDQISNHDAFGVPVYQHQIEHFGPRIHLHRACRDLVFKRLISSKQQLLAGLAAGIKGSRHLNPAKRTIRQQTAVLTRERNALRHALVDNIEADFGQAMNIRFSRPKITPFDRIVEQAENAIAVVLIVLGGVDTALRRDTVRPPR